MKSLRNFLLFGLIIFFSCDQDEMNPQGDALIFGVSYGFCATECTTLFKIEDNELFADEVDRGIPEDIPFQSTPLSMEQYELAASLLADFPDDLLASDQRVYGCPDCVDQGTIYLELRRGGQVDKWEIDPDDREQSEAIVEYKNQVLETTLELR